MNELNKNKLITSINENGNIEFLQKKINHFNLNKVKNNKKFWNNEKTIIKNNKIVYINKFLIKEDKKKLKRIQKINEVVYIEEYQKMEMVGKY